VEYFSPFRRKDQRVWVSGGREAEGECVFLVAITSVEETGKIDRRNRGLTKYSKVWVNYVSTRGWEWGMEQVWGQVWWVSRRTLVRPNRNLAKPIRTDAVRDDTLPPTSASSLFRDGTYET